MHCIVGLKFSQGDIRGKMENFSDLKLFRIKTNYCTEFLLDSILRLFNLTHEDLRKKVSHKHVGKFKCEWWRLPAYLDMDPKIKDDIERNRGLTDEPMKRQNFFEQWKHLNGENATYEALVNALLECERRADAEDVCKLLLVDKAAAGQFHIGRECIMGGTQYRPIVHGTYYFC